MPGDGQAWIHEVAGNKTVREYLDSLQRLMIVEDVPAWALFLHPHDSGPANLAEGSFIQITDRPEIYRIAA